MTPVVAVVVDEVHPLVERVAAALADAGATPVLQPWADLTVAIASGASRIDALERADVVYLDRMAERRHCYPAQFALLARWSAAHRTPVVNDPLAYWAARDKAVTAARLADAGVPTPPTVVCHRVDAVRAAHRPDEPVAVKSLYGTCAEEILVGRPAELAGIDVDELLARDGAVVVQPFVHNPDRFIWRLDIVDGRAVVVNRRYAHNDSGPPICNGTLGGRIEFLAPDAPDAAPAVSLARSAVAALGLGVAGVDLVVDPSGTMSVLEVNPEPDITRDGCGVREEFPHAIAEHLLDRAGVPVTGGVGR